MISPASATSLSASRGISSAITSCNYQLYTGPGPRAFDTTAFRAPAAGTFGNAPRNIIINPGEMQWDFAVFKNFSLGAPRLQLRAEVFNFLNHPNLGGIEGNPTNANFGRITSKTGRARHPAERAVRVLNRHGGRNLGREARPPALFLPAVTSPGTFPAAPNIT